MCLDQILVKVDQTDPVIAPVAVDLDPINCTGSKLVNFHYVPGTAPEVRGYTVRVACDASLTFGPGDVEFFTLPTGVSTFPKITEVTAGQVYDLDYAILGGSVGISAEADLFSVNFHGAGTGPGTVSLTSVDLRDLNNIPITPVVFDGTAGIPVDCTASNIPVLAGEPEYTQGLSNTVSWSDETVSGATDYYAECATDAGFTNIVLNSGWIGALTKEFTPLLDGQIYYYRVKSKDALDNESGWSNVEFSTQDATAPDTSVDGLLTYVDSFFDITYTVDLEVGSGVTGAVLWYSKDGGADTAYGPFIGNTISFDATTTGGDGVYEFYSIATDGVGNVESAPVTADATTTVDSTPPETSVDGLPTYVDSFFDITYSIDLEVGSGVTGAVLWYSLDGGAYTAYGSFTGNTISFDATTTGGDGVYEFYSIATDGAGNVEIAPVTADATTTVDTTPPGGVTDLTASRGQEKVALTWTNNGGLDQTGVEMWRAVWHDGDDVTSVYPEYDDVVGNEIPTVPANRAAALDDPAWTAVDLSSKTYPFASFTDLLPVRGLYYYVVYPVDGGGLYGDGDDASSFSYLLGDVASPYDGAVTGADITDLGTAYGETDYGTPDPFYNNECDVGPTDDFSGAGIPDTDNVIDFDDLMIFALNWDVTVSKTQPAVGSRIAQFSWVKNDDSTWSLTLAEPCANLKGVNLKAEVSKDAGLAVTAGSLMGQQGGSYFLQNIPRNGLDAGLALLGPDACITGSGELVRISLTGEFDLESIEIDARDGANKALEYSIEEATAESELPTKYMLSTNYPNPFNPSTKIDFALPEMQHVKLAIYAIDGRRIATLKDESLAAGRYTVTWTGRDDQGGLVASGIYFYRIQAGDFSRIEKMTLLK